VNRRGIAMMATSHVVDDFYQGVVPALLPFLVIERQYSYAAVAGLVLAANLLSSVAQPAFGWWGDRRPRRWLIPAGMVTAALGVSLVAFSVEYWATWVLIAIAGFGISAFHPEAARAARFAAGDSNRAMSVFALGGNIGFALGAAVTTPLLLLTGLRGAVFLIIPAALMAVLLVARLDRVLDGPVGTPKRVPHPSGPDDWPAFLRLTAVVVVRSIVFFGAVSFVALYLIHDFGTSEALGGVALSLFLLAGAGGTLLGGWLADKVGRLRSIRAGFAATIPTLSVSSSHPTGVSRSCSSRSSGSRSSSPSPSSSSSGRTTCPTGSVSPAGSPWGSPSPWVDCSARCSGGSGTRPTCAPCSSSFSASSVSRSYSRSS